MCYEVKHQFDIEEGAEPTDGNGIGDNRPLADPTDGSCRLRREDGIAEKHREGYAPANGKEGDGKRDNGKCMFGDTRPKINHGPGLVDQRGLNGHDEQQRENVARDANLKVVNWDSRVVCCPVVVELIEWRREEGAQNGHADSTDDQGDDMEYGRGHAELVRGSHDEKDEEHDDAGPKLGTVIDADADRLPVEPVDFENGNLDWRIAARGQEPHRL